MKSTNEVNVSNPTEAQRLSMNPYSLMTMYRQGYTLNMTSEGGAYVVYMKATNPNRSVSEAYVTVSKAYQLQKIRNETRQEMDHYHSVKHTEEEPIRWYLHL